MTNSESLSLLWNLINAAQVKKCMYVTDKHACSRHTVVHWETIIKFLHVFEKGSYNSGMCVLLEALPQFMYIVSRNVLHKMSSSWVITGESKYQLAVA